MAPPIERPRMPYLTNIILSLGVILFGLVMWRWPEIFNFPKKTAWFGLILSGYGLLRALLFYQHWRGPNEVNETDDEADNDIDDEVDES